MKQEQFQKLIASFNKVKARQRAVVDYGRALAAIDQSTTIDLDSGSFHNANGTGYVVEVDDSTSVFEGFGAKAIEDTNDPQYKKPISAVALDLGSQFRQSLLPFIGTTIPLPRLKLVSDMALDKEHDETSRIYDKIASLLNYLLHLKFKSSRMYGKGCNWEETQGSSWETGNIAIEFIDVSDDKTRDFEISFIPFDYLYLSASGRFIGVEREVFYGDTDVDEFDFSACEDWSDEDDFEDSRRYLEIWDLQERKIHYVSPNGDTVKESRDWESAQDFPPIVIQQCGEVDDLGVYCRGFQERFYPAWHEVIYHLSMLSHKLKESEKTKFILPQSMAHDVEFIEQLNDPTRNYAAYANEDAEEDIRTKIVPYSPIQNIDSSAQGFNFMWGRILPAMQAQPQLSRGDAPENAAYMKAGTAQIVNQVRDNNASVIKRLAAEFMERIYKVLLDYLSYNEDLDVVSDMIAADPDSEAIVKMLKQDLDVTVKITDISASSEAEKAQRLQMLIQGSQPTAQAIQALNALMAGAGYKMDMHAYVSDVYESLFGIPLAKYAERMNVADEYGNVMQRTPQQKGQMAPNAQVAEASLDALYVAIDQVDRDDILEMLSQLPDQLRNQIAELFSYISDDVIKAQFIRDLGDSMDVDNLQGEVEQFLIAWKNKLLGK